MSDSESGYSDDFESDEEIVPSPKPARPQSKKISPVKGRVSNKDDDEDDEDYGYSDSDFEDDDIENDPHIQEMAEAMRREQAQAKKELGNGHQRARSDSSSSDDTYDSGEDLAELDVDHSAPAFKISGSQPQMEKRSKAEIKRLKDRAIERLELMRMLALDTVSFELLEMEPLSEYSVYMRSEGARNNQQIASQVFESVDNEAQCEDIEMCSVSSQWPEDRVFSSHTYTTENDGHDQRSASVGISENMKVKVRDPERYMSFIRRAGYLMNNLVRSDGNPGSGDADADGDGNTAIDSTGDNQSSGDGSKMKMNVKHKVHGLRSNIFSDQLIVSPLEGLAGREITGMSHFRLGLDQNQNQKFRNAESESSLVLVCYGASRDSENEKENSTSAESSPFQNMGVVVIWKIGNYARPIRALVCQGYPNCAIFSPEKANVVLAGTEDGGLIAWDLRCKPSNERVNYSINGSTSTSSEISVPIQYASFISDGNKDDSGHTSPIIQIQCIVRGKGPKTDEKDEKDGSEGSNRTFGGSRTFQIASLDFSGCILFWTIVENSMNMNDTSTTVSVSDGGHGDLGERDMSISSAAATHGHGHGSSVGSQLSVMRTAFLKMNGTENENGNVMEEKIHSAHDFAIPMYNISNVLISGNHGNVLNISRFGEKAVPARFEFPNCPFSDVTSLSFSPFSRHLFLAGNSVGSVALFSLKNDSTNTNARPISVWEGFISQSRNIVKLEWSHVDALTFYVFDNGGSAHIFDLHEKECEPKLQVPVSEICSCVGVVCRVENVDIDAEKEKGRNRNRILVARESVFVGQSDGSFIYHGVNEKKRKGKGAKEKEKKDKVKESACELDMYVEKCMGLRTV